MKIVVLIVRLLLGLVFFVFGLNAFLQFLKALYCVGDSTRTNRGLSAREQCKPSFKSLLPMQCSNSLKTWVGFIAQQR
jgi:hypothetical protein